MVLGGVLELGDRGGVLFGRLGALVQGNLLSGFSLGDGGVLRRDLGGGGVNSSLKVRTTGLEELVAVVEGDGSELTGGFQGLAEGRGKGGNEGPNTENNDEMMLFH